MDKLLILSIELLEEQHKNQTAINVLKKSEKTMQSGISGAIKQFLPPIDREDIASILGTVHSLNYCLAYFQSFPLLLQETQFRRLLKDIISYVQYAINTELKIPISDFSDSTERMHVKLFSAIQEERTILSNENSTASFNTKNLIKNIFFDKIESIHEILHRLTNELIRIMVKFS